VRVSEGERVEESVVGIKVKGGRARVRREKRVK